MLTQKSSDKVYTSDQKDAADDLQDADNAGDNSGEKRCDQRGMSAVFTPLCFVNNYADWLKQRKHDVHDKERPEGKALFGLLNSLVVDHLRDPSRGFVHLPGQQPVHHIERGVLHRKSEAEHTNICLFVSWLFSDKQFIFCKGNRKPSQRITEQHENCQNRQKGVLRAKSDVNKRHGKA